MLQNFQSSNHQFTESSIPFCRFQSPIACMFRQLIAALSNGSPAQVSCSTTYHWAFAASQEVTIPGQFILPSPISAMTCSRPTTAISLKLRLIARIATMPFTVGRIRNCTISLMCGLSQDRLGTQ